MPRTVLLQVFLLVIKFYLKWNMNNIMSVISVFVYKSVEKITRSFSPPVMTSHQNANQYLWLCARRRHVTYASNIHLGQVKNTGQKRKGFSFYLYQGHCWEIRLSCRDDSSLWIVDSGKNISGEWLDEISWE